MRPAVAADRVGIETHLAAHLDSSMFPLMNLRAHGLGSDAPMAMTFWLDDRGVLGLTNAGMLLPQREGPWEAARACLTGRRIVGAIGPAEQVRPLLAALGLADAPMRRDADEPHMALGLADLAVPPGDTRLVPLDHDPETARAWRADFHREALGTPDPDMAAARDVKTWCARGSHRLLLDGDRPVSMTGFNAELPGIVQIGAVYTPPEYRSRGHARRAVALHLCDAREKGTSRAVLFAANEPAVRAYRAIGFRQTGRLAFVLLDGPAHV